MKVSTLPLCQDGKPGFEVSVRPSLPHKQLGVALGGFLVVERHLTPCQSRAARLHEHRGEDRARRAAGDRDE